MTCQPQGFITSRQRVHNEHWVPEQQCLACLHAFAVFVSLSTAHLRMDACTHTDIYWAPECLKVRGNAYRTTLIMLMVYLFPCPQSCSLSLSLIQKLLPEVDSRRWLLNWLNSLRNSFFGNNISGPPPPTSSKLSPLWVASITLRKYTTVILSHTHACMHRHTGTGIQTHTQADAYTHTTDIPEQQCLFCPHSACWWRTCIPVQTLPGCWYLAPALQQGFR